MRLATEAVVVSEAADAGGAVDLEEEITEPMVVVRREAALAEAEAGADIGRLPTEGMVGDMVMEGDMAVEAEEEHKAGGNPFG